MTTFSQQVSEAVAPTVATKIAYGASSAGLLVAGLTINEFVGIAIGLTSIVTMVYTARTNSKHKRRAIELLDIQIKNELIKANSTQDFAD